MVKVEKYNLRKWIDKTRYVGTKTEFTICNVKPMDNDFVADIQVDMQTDPVALRLSQGVFNDLVDRFGDETDEWVGEPILLKFTKFIPKPGQKDVSEGVKITLVEKEEIKQIPIVPESTKSEPDSEQVETPNSEAKGSD